MIIVHSFKEVGATFLEAIIKLAVHTCLAVVVSFSIQVGGRQLKAEVEEEEDLFFVILTGFMHAGHDRRN